MFLNPLGIIFLTGVKYFFLWLQIQKHTVYVFESGGCMFLNPMVTEYVFEVSGARSNVSAESQTSKSFMKPNKTTQYSQKKTFTPPLCPHFLKYFHGGRE